MLLIVSAEMDTNLFRSIVWFVFIIFLGDLDSRKIIRFACVKSDRGGGGVTFRVHIKEKHNLWCDIIVKMFQKIFSVQIYVHKNVKSTLYIVRAKM